MTNRNALSCSYHSSKATLFVVGSACCHHDNVIVHGSEGNDDGYCPSECAGRRAHGYNAIQSVPVPWSQAALLSAQGWVPH